MEEKKQQELYNKKVIYSLPVPNSETQGNSPVYRNPQSMDQLLERPSPEIATIQDQLVRSFKDNANLPCLGTQNSANTGYNWKTYSQIQAQAEKIGSGILNMNLAPTVSDEKYGDMRFVGIYSRNREEWLTIDVANILYKAVMVPLYDTLGPETISYVIGHSGIENLFVEKKVLGNLWKAGDLHNLKTIIQFEDDIDVEQLQKAESMGIKLITYNYVISEGEKNIIKEYTKVEPNDCFTFSYTSGTTGNPKAVMITHRNLIALRVSAEKSVIQIKHDDVYLSYLPLPHILERLVVTILMGYGAKIGFYRGDVLKLKDDLALIQPTLFVSVPRLYNKFFEKIKAGMNSKTGCGKVIVTKAIDSKLAKLKNKCAYTSTFWDNLVFNKTKAVLGGKCTRMVTGSAPIDSEVLDFMKICMCCPFIEGYGQTESNGASFLTSDKDPLTGHVGGPVVTLEFKTEDIPEMNYYSNQKDEQTGEIFHKGEVCVRGGTVFKGYYKDQEKTDEAIDKDGWLHTGDIGMIMPNGALKIIDRKKNLFKLSQGEYIAPEKVENIYLKVEGVAEAFLHGDSLQNYALLICHPEPNYVKKLAAELNLENTDDMVSICQNEAVKKQILSNCSAQGKKDGLKGFEQAKRIFLSPVSLADRGCMTNTMKLQRFNAKNEFAEEIKAMYALGEPGK